MSLSIPNSYGRVGALLSQGSQPGTTLCVADGSKGQKGLLSFHKRCATPADGSTGGPRSWDFHWAAEVRRE